MSAEKHPGEQKNQPKTNYEKNQPKTNHEILRLVADPSFDSIESVNFHHYVKAFVLLIHFIFDFFDFVYLRVSENQKMKSGSNNFAS